MGLVIYLVVASLLAWATASIAGSKGRDRAVWGILGFFFGLIPLIIACCVSDQRSLEGGVS
ncbi:MAG: hypothetical protein ABI467_20820 [Kofleriaceae bacterium]